MLILLGFPISPVAHAQTTEWDFIVSITSAEMLDIEHFNHLVIETADMPYVSVDYGTVLEKMNLNSFEGFFQSFPQPGESKFETTFVEGVDPDCALETWNKLPRCYKFIATYDIFDAGLPNAAKFKPVMKTPGTKFVAADGYPEYASRVRLDMEITNVPNNPDYITEKDPSDCSGFQDLLVEDLEFSGCTGQAWRVHDTEVGWMQSLGYDPIGAATFIVPLVYHDGQLNPASVWGEYNNYASNSEDILDVDLVVWVIMEYDADSTHCVPGHPCIMQGLWIPNNI
ncbi:MAG: hypothetical protein ACREAZ_10970 [Nitrososphaera sp.]